MENLLGINNLQWNLLIKAALKYGEVSISSKGKITVNGKIVTFDELKNMVMKKVYSEGEDLS